MRYCQSCSLSLYVNIMLFIGGSRLTKKVKEQYASLNLPHNYSSVLAVDALLCHLLHCTHYRC